MSLHFRTGSISRPDRYELRSAFGAAARLLALALPLALLAPGPASPVELRDAELAAGAWPELSNASGTLRLQQGRLDGLGHKVSFAPEPGAAWQLGAGLALLVLLASRRCARAGAPRSGAGGPLLALGALLLCAALASPALAQVPQHTTFTGQLADETGAPLAGPVDLELRIYGTLEPGPIRPFYSETHLGVELDAAGGFSVQLGLGTSPFGTYDASVFAFTSRYLEVWVNGEVLSPRQRIAAVPWALVAERANEVRRDPTAPRFEDCGDGTVADHRTGLQWEKKTGTRGFSVDCSAVGCPDLHDVNNVYQWSTTGTDPDGDLFTNFLSLMNGGITPIASPGCFANRCDWRVPAVGEIRTIIIGLYAAEGQDPNCPAGNCIDPDFAAVAGPDSLLFWSGTTFDDLTAWAWQAQLGYDGWVFPEDKTLDSAVRGVRTGSCNW